MLNLTVATKNSGASTTVIRTPNLILHTHLQASFRFVLDQHTPTPCWMQCSKRLALRRTRPLHTPKQPSHTTQYHRPQFPTPRPLFHLRRHDHVHHQQRSFILEALPTILVPPAVFSGLLIALWVYKCMMMVVFQNKIIYMPSVPPFSRGEKVADYANRCRPVEWREHGIRSQDGTRIKLLEGMCDDGSKEEGGRHVVVLYFQGNASSLPPRLPYLSRVLAAAAKDSGGSGKTRYSIVALSYRGFWTSSGRPSQPGIELDTQAALDWVFEKYASRTTKIVVWGQSIGAGAASVALANLAKSDDGESKLSRVSGLLLETPFVDLRTMLIALYPQRFLPYRYLAPFLLSTWDSKTALTVIGNVRPDLRVFMLQAGGDELVPSDNAPTLAQVCRNSGLQVEMEVVAGALHTEVVSKPQGRSLIAKFIGSFGDR